MNIDTFGYPYWTAPSGKNYVLPKEYIKCGDDLIAILQQLLQDKLIVEYRMIKEELGLI